MSVRNVILVALAYLGKGRLSEVNATLYDISCQYNSTSISAISTAFNGLAANAISKLGSANFKHSASTLSGIAGRLLRRLGSLSTLDNTTYTFDFRTTAGGPLVNTSAFASGPIYATQSAPIPSYNVPWLRITTSNGSLAKEVFQVQTAGGYPLTMGLGCTEGSTDSVTFSAQYCLCPTINKCIKLIWLLQGSIRRT